MERKTFSVKKVIAILLLSLLTLATSAAASTQIEPPLTLIQQLNAVCLAIANSGESETLWISDYTQCAKQQGIYLSK